MRKQLIITLILLAATVYITVVYFKNLSTPEMRTSQVMRAIPDDAALIFEFNNDKTFYDIFNNNQLFAAIAGKQNLGDLDTLRQVLLQNRQLNPYFSNQNIFVSLHQAKNTAMGLLLTSSAGKGFDRTVFEKFTAGNSGMVVTPLRNGDKNAYSIFINILKKPFYLVIGTNNTFSGSFSKEIIDGLLAYKNPKEKQPFALLSEQQSANSLANLYVNYKQLSALLDGLFINQNNDLFKRFALLPGHGALNLNYRSDALMFNGETHIVSNNATGYLNIFGNQLPVVNHIKDIFPSTTAYGINFSISDPVKFSDDLEQWHIKGRYKQDRDSLTEKIRTETGTNLKKEFNGFLGDEFAVITTRYFEKFGVISVKDGSKIDPWLTAFSTMSDGNAGQFNYDKIPFLLLGDAFWIFKRPYFMIIDNYLILANTPGELKSFKDSYLNRKFLSKNEQYIKFDDLLAERSNIAFFFDFKNLLPVLKRDMDPKFYTIFEQDNPGWQNYYGASWQFTSAGHSFYTNFCMRLNTDSTSVDKN